MNIPTTACSTIRILHVQLPALSAGARFKSESSDLLAAVNGHEVPVTEVGSFDTAPTTRGGTVYRTVLAHTCRITACPLLADKANSDPTQI